MSELGDAAQETWKEPFEACRSIWEQLDSDDDVDDDHRTDELDAVNYLCACVALAEAIRWVWDHRAGKPIVRMLVPPQQGHAALLRHGTPPSMSEIPDLEAIRQHVAYNLYARPRLSELEHRTRHLAADLAGVRFICGRCQPPSNKLYGAGADLVIEDDPALDEANQQGPG